MNRIFASLLLFCAKRFGRLSIAGWPTCSTALACVAVLAVTTISTADDSIILNATNRGHYNQTSAGGFNLADGDSTSTANYATGDAITNNVRESRSFFVFSLSDVTGRITTAELRLFNPVDGFGTTQSVSGLETFDVFDVDNTSVSDLTSATNPSGSFSDLGTGIPYGTRFVSVSDNNTTIVVPLNEDALDALNASTEPFFAFGGAITTVVDPFTDQREQVFGFSFDFPASATQLVLTVVPEPKSLTYLVVGCLGLALGRGQRGGELRRGLRRSS